MDSVLNLELWKKDILENSWNSDLLKGTPFLLVILSNYGITYYLIMVLLLVFVLPSK